MIRAGWLVCGEYPVRIAMHVRMVALSIWWSSITSACHRASLAQDWLSLFSVTCWIHHAILHWRNYLALKCRLTFLLIAVVLSPSLCQCMIGPGMLANRVLPGVLGVTISVSG